MVCGCGVNGGGAAVICMMKSVEIKEIMGRERPNFFSLLFDGKVVLVGRNV